MKCRWLIVDGYSLVHRDPEIRSLPATNLMLARERMVRKLESVAGAFAEKITVVFDGRDQPSGSGDVVAGIQVIYSTSGMTADSVIERLVHAHAQPGEITVVTSDRRERETVMASGADTISCGNFLDLCERTRKQMRPGPSSRSGQFKGPTLGDFFPGDEEPRKVTRPTS